MSKMAVIKIKTIKTNLQAVINYAKNGDKTDNGILVDGVNCTPSTAYEQMALTKKFYHKDKGVLGYHIIQSFNGNEVSPEKANKIGKELAEELWGDKYQVLVCTHINKANVHNHIILNSVSFIDGKKYHNSNTEIAILRDTSDRLCTKYDLSVVKTIRAEKQKIYRDKRIESYNRSDEKMQKIRLDIDEAIKGAKKYINFKNMLKEKGYIIYDAGKYFTVKSPYFNRKVRLNRAFGEDYSLDGIKHRIYCKSKKLAPVLNFNKKYYKKVYIGPEINQFLLKTSSFYRLYVHYLYKLGKLPPKVVYKELTPEYFKKKRENNRIFEELNFINRKNFQSIQEVRDYKENCERLLPELKSKRENLWRKYNKTDNETEKEEIKQDIVKLSEKIKTINNHSKICSRYIDRLKRLKEEYRQMEEEKSKIQEMDRKEKVKSRYR